VGCRDTSQDPERRRVEGPKERELLQRSKRRNK
jgi:hypothetical protein